MNYLDVIARANTANLAQYLPLWFADEQVGLIWRQNIDLLQHYGFHCQRTARGLEWLDADQDVARNSANLKDICQRMNQDGHIPGWRDELFSLAHDYHTKVHALVERAALPYFGACGYGVHINGLTVIDGMTHMWLAKRAMDKPTDPGKLDQIAAGGLPHGLSAVDNMMKECEEEASIPAALSKKATPVGTVSYLYQSPIGIRSDVMFNYDLWLPADFTPASNDGEVAAFECLPISAVRSLILNGESIKFNSALVMIDFFVRYGYITPAQTDYQSICSLLRQREIRLTTWLTNNFSL